MELRTSNKYSSFFWGFLIVLLFAIGKIQNNNLIIAFATFVVAISIAFFKLENSILLFFFLVPNTSFLVFNGNGIVGYIAMLIVIKILVLKRTSVKGIWPILFTGVIVVISSVINNWFSSIFSYIKVFFYFALMLQATHLFSNKSSSLCLNYVVGAFSGALLGLGYGLISGFSILSLDRYNRFRSLSDDPNYYSAILVFAIALLIVLVLNKRIKIIASLPVFIVLLFSGLSSLSRGFALTLFLVFALSFIAILFSKKIKFLTKIGIFASAAFAAFLIIKYTNAFSMIMSRFEEDTISTGSGRIDIWMWYLQRGFSSFKNIMIGSGSAHRVVDSGLMKYIEHNTYIQIFNEIGIIGFALYFSSYLYFFLLINKKRRTKAIFVTLILLSAVVIPYLFLSQMYGENFVISILISLFFISETNTSRNKATEKNYLDNKRMNHNNANGLVRAI